jgi:hypothetical protein
MRYAEVKVDKVFTVKVNTAEHKAFKSKCLKNDKEMAEVLRAFMREYAAKK